MNNFLLLLDPVITAKTKKQRDIFYFVFNNTGFVITTVSESCTRLLFFIHLLLFQELHGVNYSLIFYIHSLATRFFMASSFSQINFTDVSWMCKSTHKIEFAMSLVKIFTLFEFLECFNINMFVRSSFCLVISKFWDFSVDTFYCVRVSGYEAQHRKIVKNL